MILCKQCRTPIFAKLNTEFLFIGTIGLTQKGVRINTGEIVKTPGSTIRKLIPYCSSCNKELEYDELVSYCYHCREYFDLKDLNMLDRLGILVCDECRESFEGIPSTNKAIDVLSKGIQLA